MIFLNLLFEVALMDNDRAAMYFELDAKSLLAFMDAVLYNFKDDTRSNKMNKTSITTLRWQEAAMRECSRAEIESFVRCLLIQSVGKLDGGFYGGLLISDAAMGWCQGLRLNISN